MVGDLKGRLLVSLPHLVDDNFARSVVLLIEHTDEGAVGVVLNRPTDVEVREAVPSLGPLAADPAVVFFGGPVSPTAAVCLASASPEHPPASWIPIAGSLGVVDLSRPVEQMEPGLGRIRLFAGYAGWGPGQLEAEIAQGSWFVVPSEIDDALGQDPLALWRTVLRRQGGTMAWVGLFPPDPSMN